LGFPDRGVAMQAAAVTAALGGAALLAWTERRAAQQQEALIGVSFVLAACAGILVLAGNSHGGEHLKDLLVGQILWVDGAQLGWLALVSALVLVGLRAGVTQRFGRFGFYGLFALAVTASVQLVGVYLVFSSLIIPALATRSFAVRRRPLAGYALGGAGFALGLVLSALFDLPSGAVIAWALAGCGFLAAALHGRRAER
jgi:zinc/manganese transport system permease protein